MTTVGDVLSVVTAQVFVAAYAPTGKSTIEPIANRHSRNHSGPSHHPMNTNQNARTTPDAIPTCRAGVT